MGISARELQDIERTFPDGLSSRQILELLEQHGESLTEATLRKYVQLGLLPRSRRVGQKGKHRGSLGIYPVEVIRRVDEIRRAMSSGQTLESIARSARTVRARLPAVRAAIDDVLASLEGELGDTAAIEKGSRAELRAEFGELRKEARAFARSLERVAGALERATRAGAGRDEDAGTTCGASGAHRIRPVAHARRAGKRARRGGS